METSQPCRFIRNNWVNILLFIFAVLSIISITAIKFCPSWRLSCNLPDATINNINDAILQFAFAYISACIFYLLTVVLKNEIHSRQQRSIISNEILDLNNLIHNLLDEQGVDKAYSICDVINELIESEDASKRLLQLKLDSELTAVKALWLMSQKWEWNDEELWDISHTYQTCRAIESIANYPLNEKQDSVLLESLRELKKISSRLTNLSNRRIGVK